MLTTPIKKLVKSLREFRVLHRWVGIPLGLFMIVMAVTGLALGWKKHVALLQPVTRDGKSSNLSQWRSLDEIARLAEEAMVNSGNGRIPIDRMDVRPKDGVVKVQFKEGWWEVQIDATTGEVLSLGRRHADWIEKVHDGSIFTDLFKLVYTNITGIGLTLLAASGLWLWMGPRVVRRLKALQRKNG